MKICTYPLLLFVIYAQALVFIKHFEFLAISHQKMELIIYYLLLFL